MMTGLPIAIVSTMLFVAARTARGFPRGRDKLADAVARIAGT